jgi:hypothetical protein
MTRDQKSGKRATSSVAVPEPFGRRRIARATQQGAAKVLKARCAVGFGKGLLLWIIGIPLPIILLLALFWR